MQTSNRLFDEIARMANGMMGVASSLRSELEGMIKARLTAMLAEGNLVPREDFEVVKEVAAKARSEQEALAAKVAALATEQVFPAGQPIFREGDAGREMYVVVEGRVRISKQVQGIGEEALTILDPGSYFGEMAVIDDAPRSADALAHVTARLAVIRRDDLDQLLFIDKDLAYTLPWTFVRTLCDRLRETNDKIKAFFAMTRF